MPNCRRQDDMDDKMSTEHKEPGEITEDDWVINQRKEKEGSMEKIASDHNRHNNLPVNMEKSQIMPTSS